MSLNTETTMQVQPVYGNGNGGFGWGGDWASWIILFLIFGMFGWGGYGNSGGVNNPAGQGWATRADINEGFALNNLESGQRDILGSVTSGFHGVDNAICQLGYQTQQGFNNTNVALMQGHNALATQLANCCCETREAIQGVNYNLATQACDTRNTIQNSTRDIIDNQTSGINAIMGKLSQMEYNGLNDKYQAALAENQALKFQASQTAQNAFITANQEAQTAELLRRLGRDCPVPAYWVNPPTPVPVPCGTCNTCGC